MVEKLRIASCQFPVTSDISRNSRYIAHFLTKAKNAGADLLHTSEACLSGYAGVEFTSFDSFNWGLLRRETDRLRQLASKLNIWLALGSAHYLDENTKPTNCLYLFNPAGEIEDRYDKRMCTIEDQRSYSAGNHLVTFAIKEVCIGLAICYDICYPQLYAAYRENKAQLMLHSFHNAHDSEKNCLDVLNVRQVPTRCADNHMWAVANNSSHPYSHFASFVSRPDATIAQQLKRNVAGMLIHDFPDGLSKDGWIHNRMPMKIADNEQLTFGQPSMHPRQLNPQAEP